MAKRKGIQASLGRMMAQRPDLDKKIMILKKSFDEVSGILKTEKKKS